MLRLQGIDHTDIVQAVNEMRLRSHVGNAISVNIMERIVSRLLPAAGLTTGIEDPWQNGKAIAKLREARGSGPTFASVPFTLQYHPSEVHYLGFHSHDSNVIVVTRSWAVDNFRLKYDHYDRDLQGYASSTDPFY